MTTGISPRSHCGTVSLLIHNAANPAMTPTVKPGVGGKLGEVSGERCRAAVALARPAPRRREPRHWPPWANARRFRLSYRLPTGRACPRIRSSSARTAA